MGREREREREMGSKKHRQSDTKNPCHVCIGHTGDTSTFMFSFCWAKKKKKNSLILDMFLTERAGKTMNIRSVLRGNKE